MLVSHDGTWSARRYFSFWLICFLTHQTAINLFRCMGAIGRSLVVAYTMAWLIFLLLILLSGTAFITRVQTRVHLITVSRMK